MQQRHEALLTYFATYRFRRLSGRELLDRGPAGQTL
jgi:hypothetical protein